jgi:hypothetical protein
MKKSIVSCLTVALASGMSAPVMAGSLENLERERALAVVAMLDSTMDVEARWNKLSLAKARLADLEVIVISDKSLKNSHSIRTKQALSNYELTFLAHASAEFDKSIAAHWFDSVGLSTDQIMASRVAR